MGGGAPGVRFGSLPRRAHAQAVLCCGQRQNPQLKPTRPRAAPCPTPARGGGSPAPDSALQRGARARCSVLGAPSSLTLSPDAWQCETPEREAAVNSSFVFPEPRVVPGTQSPLSKRDVIEEMNDGDYLSLWLQSRLRSFGMVSLSGSLSGEFGLPPAVIVLPGPSPPDKRA